MKTGIRSCLIISALLLAVLTALADAKVVGKAAEYHAEGTALKGYLAYNDSVVGKRAGVLVVHEWWGHNEYARKRARMLAKLGYVALAVDMYGEGKQAEHPADAKKFSSYLLKNFSASRARFDAALAYLKQQQNVDPKRIAAIGYCFGGGVVLNMARQGADLKGAASFYGDLTAVQPASPGSIKAKVRVYNGGADKFVTPEQIAALKKEMKRAGADFKFVNYPGAKHGFTNADADGLGRKFDLPLAYNAKADKKSWKELERFLAKIFR